MDFVRYMIVLAGDDLVFNAPFCLFSRISAFGIYSLMCLITSSSCGFLICFLLYGLVTGWLSRLV